MIKFILFSLGLFVVGPSLASSIQIAAIGSSPKGQFVAIEEYGYNQGLKTYYSKIRFMNLWKKEYAGPTVEIEQGARHPDDLKRVREKAKRSAEPHFEQFNIVTSS